MRHKKYEELSHWVEKAKNGDENAFRYLYDYTYKSVRFLVYNFTDEKEEMEDIVQDIYISIFNSIEYLKDNKAFLAWVNKIAHRCCIKAIRKNSNLISKEEDEKNVYVVISEGRTEPLEIVLKDEKNKLLLDCIHKLPEKQKVTLIMNVYSELKYREIAAALEVSEDNVKKNLRMAKKNLKKIIDELPTPQKSLLTARSVGVLTFYQKIRMILRGMTGEVPQKAFFSGYKIAIGVAVVSMGIGGSWYGITHNFFGANDQQIEGTISSGMEQSKIPSEKPVFSQTDMTVVETEEETGEPELLSWNVESNQLLIKVQDEIGIDYENTYGVTFSGKKIKPLKYDESDGILYFHAEEDDFYLHLKNKDGGMGVWKMKKKY